MTNLKNSPALNASRIAQAKDNQPKINRATGRVLLNISNAPSSMVEFQKGRGK